MRCIGGFLYSIFLFFVHFQNWKNALMVRWHRSFTSGFLSWFLVNFELPNYCLSKIPLMIVYIHRNLFKFIWKTTAGKFYCALWKKDYTQIKRYHALPCINRKLTLLVDIYFILHYPKFECLTHFTDTRYTILVCMYPSLFGNP